VTDKEVIFATGSTEILISRAVNSFEGRIVKNVMEY